MKKLLLTGATLMTTVLLSFGQTMTATSYSDNFDDNALPATAESGWYGNAIYSVSETGGKLDVAATNADQDFAGFGLWMKPTTKIDVSANKTVTMDVTNTHPTQSMKLRVDLKLRDAAFTGPNCPTASGDTINVNKNVTNSVIIPANTTQSVTFNYAGSAASPAGYEYDSDCSTPASFDATTYTVPAAAWTDMVGLYIVVNGGAGASWCDATLDPTCVQYSDNFTFDNLVIGGITASVNKASANIASSKLSPNPVSDMVKVELNLKSSSNVKVTLTDLMGREVDAVEATTASLTHSFNVSTLTKGLYTVNYFINGAPAKAELLMVK